MKKKERISMLYSRSIQPLIEAELFKGKIIVIYGARQVGKTTLLKEIIKKFPGSLYLNCDEPDISTRLTNRTSTELRNEIGNHTLVFIDEGQRVKNIGLTLKLLVDNFPELQVVVTGSSSLVLSNTIAEPLTGRKREFFLYPLSMGEIMTRETLTETNRLLEHRLVFGLYPEVITSRDPLAVVESIVSSYIFRDVFEYQVVRNKDLVLRLLQSLALQIGSEVSNNELGTTLGLDKSTISRYVDIMEQAHIIYHLPPLSRNLRKELGKKRKIYFYDVGVRNALIKNFNAIHLRNDIGMLWENFVITERIKLLGNQNKHANIYFWRTYQGQEIDYLEEYAGKIFGIECKWTSEKRWKPPGNFLGAYPNSECHLVHRGNYLEFVK